MINQIKFDEAGLVPAIVQDATTGNVLMLAYMNKESLEKTLETNETWFFSRSRQELWNKGATSGNKQSLKGLKVDCDGDALLVEVDPLGPACHTGEDNCFFTPIFEKDKADRDIIHQITQLITDRADNPKEGSYTTYLLTEGIDKVLKKIGEEASEVIIGAKNNDQQEITWEIADLVYHTLVLMNITNVSLEDIKQELAKRHLPKDGEINE